MDIRETILTLLEDLTGTEEVRENPDVDVFEEELLDSFAVVELLLGIEEELGVSISPSDFDRDKWSTPNKMIEQVEAHL
jgi:D-alanine--poly(phosphoribitol) ligase subunit 2